MPIRLTQVEALGHEVAYERLPRSLLDFQRLFLDEIAFARHLERIRWPEEIQMGQINLW